MCKRCLCMGEEAPLEAASEFGGKGLHGLYDAILKQGHWCQCEVCTTEMIRKEKQ